MKISTWIGISVLAVLPVIGITATAGRYAPVKRSAEEAIERALPYLARQTALWTQTHKCTSCHQVPHALWAMNEAERLGFEVDERVAGWNLWSVEFVVQQAAKMEGGASLASERADELSQLLLGGSAREVQLAEKGDRESGYTSKLVELLHQARPQGGKWRAGGRLPDQKRPQQETDEVTSMWSVLALRSQGGGGGPEDAELGTEDVQPQSTSTEHLALRYVLAAGWPDDTGARKLQHELLSNQNDDGGWGWLLDGESDALGTGQALFALARAGNDEARLAVDRARSFLLHSQQTEGFWRVPSTLKGHEDPYVVSNDWGTAWAVIGLTQTQDP